MFDLATVVAVAAAARGLTEDISSDRFALGAIKFASSFFMVWLAWMNYTWFASGYDNRSAVFRFLPLVIIFGSFTLTGGIQNDAGDQPIWLELVDFIILRLELVEGRRGDVVLAAGTRGRRSELLLLQHPGDRHIPRIASGASSVSMINGRSSNPEEDQDLRSRDPDPS